MSEQVAKRELTAEEIRLEQARWCYAHASRPVAEVDMLEDVELDQLAEMKRLVEKGEIRLDDAMTAFLAQRRTRLEEAKAVVAEDEPAEDE